MPQFHVLLLFGGKNTEHEVSVSSARSIYDALDKTKYRVTPVAIAKDGKWLRGPAVEQALLERKAVTGAEEAIALLPDPTSKRILSLGNQQNAEPEINVIFPVIHGRWGEDGALQGLLEMANLPYVGSGVLASAVGMDKVKQKEICAYHKIPVVKFTHFTTRQWIKDKAGTAQKALATFAGKYPLFVKPANAGSSVGISKVKSAADFEAAVDFASKFDTKIIIEEGVEDPREIETAVLGNQEPLVSVCGEVVPAGEFYDYNSKYKDDNSKLMIPAELAPEASEKIREIAAQTFKVLDLRGMSRVDFLVSKKDGGIWLNEVNTIPGFTKISMYPKMWEHSGVPYPKLVEKLIELAIEEWEEKQKLETSWAE